MVKGQGEVTTEHIIRKKVPRGESRSLALATAFSQVSSSGDRTLCKICNTPYLRWFILDQYQQGYSLTKIRNNIKDEFDYVPAQQTIDKHLEEHEVNPVPWMGMVKSKFSTEEERKKYEMAFLSRISLVTELWDKYSVLSQLFTLMAGDKENINMGLFRMPNGIDKVTKLATEMRNYLNEMLVLQKERDLIVAVSKTVLYTMADKFVERLGNMISELPAEKKDAIGKLLVEEVKNAIEFAKNIGKDKVEEMMKKVNKEMEKIGSTIA